MSGDKIKASYFENNINCYIFDNKQEPGQDVVACVTQSNDHKVSDLALRRVALNALTTKGGYTDKDIVEIVPGGEKANSVKVSKLSAAEVLKVDLKPGKFSAAFMYAQKKK